MSSKTVQIIDAAANKTATLPVVTGTLGDPAFDIGKLNKETGYFTFDPGFLSTASCNSAITYIDGDKGELLYRGYPIEELATRCDFMETCYLLLYGELPTPEQKAAFVPRAPNGGADRACGRAIRVLPRFDEPA